MKNEKLVYAIGGIADQYISEAAEDEAPKGTGRRTALRRKTVFLIAAAAAALLLCGAAVYAAAGGDLWWQIPSGSPEEVVREALEQQVNKDYTISIEIESVTVDPEETARARNEYISGVIAQRRGWSDEYLKEHFAAVEAVYHAQYDHTKTTRSDGDVVMYFYLTRDVDSGKWSIVDNSGNMNLTQSPGPKPSGKPGPETGTPTPSVMPSFQDQITAYLTDQFTKKSAQFYDGLHYEMSGYEETVEDGVCTAIFLWTEYWLGKGWDVGSDEGVEQEANWPLQVTAEVDSSGMLDLSTILVYQDHGQTSGPDYGILEEFSAPLPRIQWKQQLTEYMTGRYAEKYASLCDSDSLICYLSYYEEKEKDGMCTAAFLLSVLYPGDDGPYGPTNEVDIYDVQLTAAVGEDGLLDMGAVSILMENQLPDPPGMVGPGFPSWQQLQVEAYLTGLFNDAYSPYYDGLHYEIRQEDYRETVEDGVYTATFLWTMYHLGKGWDVPGDEGVEQEGNMHLRVTAAIKNSGVLDLDTISVLLGTGARGPLEYSSPIEELFPS